MLLMMISIGATIGESAITSDAIRAYLNAEVLDPNLVVIASPYMKAIPPKGLLNKGLYGTLKGALGWEVWIDKRIIGEMEFKKCSIPRGMYVKVEDEAVTRLYRHSDDFRMSSKDPERMRKTADEFSKRVRMGEWKQCDRFLGMTIEYHLNTSGDFSRGNNVACLRGTEKIVEMIEKFNIQPKGKEESGATEVHPEGGRLVSR
jgi:hypothetical protein